MQPSTSFSPVMALTLFIVIIALAMLVTGPLLRVWLASNFEFGSESGQVLVRAGSAIFFLWLNLGLTIIILRLRGQTLTDIGWGKPALFWGWVTAFAVVGFIIWSAFSAFEPNKPKIYALNPHTWLTDWSLFRVGLALAIGVTVGICEETMFRGFVITQARDAGLPLAGQIAMSAVLFGLAHAGWGGMAGSFNILNALSAVVSTTVFGAIFAVVYLLGGRSLMPVIAGHALYGATLEPWMMMTAIRMTTSH